jgi:hypothetical protein
MGALYPGNPLIFSMGPLSGAAVPSSGRTDFPESEQDKSKSMFDNKMDFIYDVTLQNKIFTG